MKATLVAIDRSTHVCMEEGTFQRKKGEGKFQRNWKQIKKMLGKEEREENKIYFSSLKGCKKLESLLVRDAHTSPDPVKSFDLIWLTNLIWKTESSAQVRSINWIPTLSFVHV